MTKITSKSVHFCLESQNTDILIPTFLYETTAPFDLLPGTDVVQGTQAVMGWTSQGLQTCLIRGLADELAHFYQPITSLSMTAPALTDLTCLAELLSHIPQVCSLALGLEKEEDDEDIKP